MKYIKYILFTMIILSLNIFYVNASCTEEELSNLKLEADKIKITYKHLGKVENEGEIHYNVFEVKVKNISDDMYISLFNGTTTFIPSNNEIVETFNNGTWIFDIYANQCQEKITSIKVFIPRFNTYSLDPLCEGIDGEDFPLCGKYYEYDVSYNSFKERVTHYRNTHNINNNTTDNENNDKISLKELLNYITKYRIYIVIPLTILLIILIIIIIIKKRKKRGVLQ